MKAIEHRAFKSTIYGFIQFTLTFIQSILLVPLLLSHWGQEKYGIYIAVFAFIQLLRTLDFGHQSFVGNEFNKEYFLDKDKAEAILVSSIKMALVLGGVELLVFILLWATGAVYPLLGLSRFTSSLIMVGILGMVFMWWVIGSVAGVMARAVLTKGLYAETILWAIGLKVIEIIFLVIAGIVNLSIFNLLWIWAIVNIIYMVFATQWTMRHLIDFKKIWTIGSWKLAFLGLRNSVVLTFNNGFEQLNSNGIIFLITRFISLAILPVYITLRTLTNMAVQFTGLIISPLQPELIRYHSERSGDKIYSVFQTVWIITGIIVNVALLAVIPFIGWIYALWTKGMLIFNKELFYLLCLSTSLANFGKIMTTYVTGINDLKAITLISSTRCIIIFGVSLIFIGNYGLLAIGFGFLAAEIISSVGIPIYLTRHKLRILNSHIHPYDIILGLLPIGILALCYLVDSLYHYNAMAIVLLGVIAMSFVYLTQWSRLHTEVRVRLKLLTLRIARRD